MEVAYSREAMHTLLALDGRERMRAVAAAESLAEERFGYASGGDGASPEILPMADGSDVRLVPYSPTGDLVVTFEKEKATVLALINVIGGLGGTDQP